MREGTHVHSLAKPLRLSQFAMEPFRFTTYFEKQVLRKRPYLRREWCVYVIENALRSEPQEGNRWRF